MPHTCNPWCFGGLHALLFDSTLAEAAALDRIGGSLAARYGFRFVSISEVRPAGAPAPGTPTPDGIARGRMVIWAAPVTTAKVGGRVAS